MADTLTQQAKHTPGPWHVKSEPTAISGDEGDFTTWYSFTAKADKHTFAEHEANARLMEAAPELLAALKAISTIPPGMDAFTWINDPHTITAFDQARAAITKAEGCTP